MSHGRPFWCSSFLHDDSARAAAPPPTAGERFAQAGARHEVYGMQEAAEEQDADHGDSDAEEVFYDHQSGVPREELGRASPSATTSLTDTRAKSGDTFPASTFTSTAAAAPAPRESHHAAPAATAAPALARVLDLSVMTMDNAVRVPSALRSAGRRTMFDVLADWDAIRARQQAAPAPPPQPQAETQKQNPAPRPGRPAVDAASAAREVTYSALFPRAALGSATRKEAGLASSSHDQKPHDAQLRSKPITVSSTTDSVASTAVITRGSATTTPAAAVARTSAMSSTESVKSASAATPVAQSPDATAPPVKPDRRLRHLLPVHLRGHHRGTGDDVDAAPHDTTRATDAKPDTKRASNTSRTALLRDEQLGGRRQRGGADGAAVGEERHTRRQDDVSDVSSISTDGLVDADRGDAEVHQRAVPSRAAAPASFLARLVDADTSGWDVGVPSPRPSQQRGDHRVRTTPSGWRAMEANLSRSPPVRRHRRSSRSSSTSNSEEDDKGQHASARDPRTRHGVLDLNRLMDDDVPPWLLRHQAEEASRRQRLQAADTTHPPPHPQQGRALAASALGAVEPLEEAYTTAAERVAAAQRLIGRPTRFCPSSTAPRNTTAAAAASHGGVGCPPRAVAAAAPSLPPPPLPLQPLASRLRATWKEGARLLKQRHTNATAVGVVEYLWQRFLAWKPCGLRLLGQLSRGVCLGGRATPPRTSTSLHDEEDEENEERDGVAAHAHHRPECRARAASEQSSSIEDISLGSGEAGGEEQHQRTRTSVQRIKGTKSAANVTAAAAPAEATDGSEGVAIQFLVLELEAAFGLVTVRGELTWASETACQQLGLAYPLATLPAGPAWSDARRRWALVLPEPALMQVPVGLHEHLYLAPPYTVFTAAHAVLSSYNFTTDALLRQHAAAAARSDDGHGGEGLADTTHAAGRTSRWGAAPRSGTETAAHDADEGRLRQRGVSPARGGSPYDAVSATTPQTAAAAAPCNLSPYGRSPVAVGEATDTRRRGTPAAPFFGDIAPATPPGHPRRPDERAGEAPARTAASADLPLRTPERAGRGGGGGSPLGASPEPHPPHAGYHRPPTGPQAVVPGVQLSTSPSFVRPSAASVSSIAGDGFYDPLAMPALPTTDAAVRHGRLAAAAAAAPCNSHAPGLGGPAASDFTVVLTGASADAMGVQGEVLRHPSNPPPRAAAPGAETGDVSPRGRALPIPPPLSVVGAPGTAATAMPTVWAAPLLDDSMGDGFARGPGAEWDVPVEVLIALSRGCHLDDGTTEDDGVTWEERNAARGGSGGGDSWGSPPDRGGHGDALFRHERSSSSSSGSDSTHPMRLPRHKRYRRDVHDGGERNAATPPPPEQHMDDRVFSSTISLSTPVPTPTCTAHAGGAVHCRATSPAAPCSSLSSLSEIHEDDRVAPLPPPPPSVSHARPSRGTRRTAPVTRHQLLQRERQEQQARWMRALWGSANPRVADVRAGAQTTHREGQRSQTATVRVSSATGAQSAPQRAAVAPILSWMSQPHQQEESAAGPTADAPFENADLAAVLPDDFLNTPAHLHTGLGRAHGQPPPTGPHASSPIVAAHPLPEDEGTTASTGFFALQDVYLSDSD